MKINWQRLKTLKEHRKADLNRFLRILSLLIILFSGYFTEFIIDDTEAWRMTLNLYRLSFLLLILTIKSRVKEIAVALLINHFFDRYFGKETEDNLTSKIILSIGTLISGFILLKDYGIIKFNN